MSTAQALTIDPSGDPLPEMPDDLTIGWREWCPKIRIRYLGTELEHRFTTRGSNGRNYFALERVHQTWWAFRVVDGARTNRLPVHTFEELLAYLEGGS